MSKFLYQNDYKLNNNSKQQRLDHPLKLGWLYMIRQSVK